MLLNNPKFLAVGAACALTITTGMAALGALPGHAASLCSNDGLTGVTAQLLTVTVSGTPADVCELTFTSSSAVTWTVPDGVTSVDALLVGGGGAGGMAVTSGDGGTDNGSGGGGGGGDVTLVTGKNVTKGDSLQVVAGAGGAGRDTSNTQGNGLPGSATSLGSDSAAGGLGGEGAIGKGPEGGASGSGNRGGYESYVPSTRFGTTAATGGGGGGDTTVGTDGRNGTGDLSGGDGGAGGTPTGGLFAGNTLSYGGGGGGGAVANLTSGKGADGGGGGGGGLKVSGAMPKGADGTAQTGGGGGGGGMNFAAGGAGLPGAGGSGVVRIRFLAPPAPPAPPVPPAPPAPAPEPEPTATPTPTPTVTALPTLEPTLPGANPNIPAGGVPLGGSVFLVNGQPVPVTVRPDAPSTANATGLDVEGDGWRMRLVGRTENDKPLGVTADGALILEQDRTAYTEGTGFKPSSEVQLYLFSTARFLGTVKTDANGSFSGSVQLPLDIAAGRHTLQSNGLAPDGAVRSLSLGVQVQDTATPTAKPTVRRAKATVTFAAMSSVLDASAKKSLRALAQGRAKSTIRIVSVGYVQPSDTTSNDKTLSTARAKAVASYLKSIGVKGVVVTRGDGVAKETGAAGRKAVVTITYRK